MPAPTWHHHHGMVGGSQICDPDPQGQRWCRKTSVLWMCSHRSRNNIGSWSPLQPPIHSDGAGGLSTCPGQTEVRKAGEEKKVELMHQPHRFGHWNGPDVYYQWCHKINLVIHHCHSLFSDPHAHSPICINQLGQVVSLPSAIALNSVASCKREPGQTRWQ